MAVAIGPAMHIPKFTRREFCVHSCQTVSLAALASVITGCGGSSPTSPSGSGSGGGSAASLPVINATVSGGAIALTIDSSSPLASIGSAALVQSSSGGVLVAHNATDTFTAVTAVCTHEGCGVTGFQNQTYVCPCHGSEYTISGTVVKGPATRPLRQFATRFANNVLTITL